MSKISIIPLPSGWHLPPWLPVAPNAPFTLMTTKQIEAGIELREQYGLSMSASPEELQIAIQSCPPSSEAP